MSTVRRIAKNTGFLVIGDIISKILSLLLVVFLARYLGDVGLGKYSFALAFTGLFFVLASFGLDPLIIREVARNKEEADKFLANTAVIRLTLSIFIFLLVIVAINLLNYPSLTKNVVYLIALSQVFLNLAGVFRSIFRGFERMEYELLVSTTERVVTCSLGITLLIFGYGLIAVSLGIVIGSFISLLLSVLFVSRNFARPRFELDFAFWRYALKEASPFLLSGIFVMIYFQIDTVMLSMMKGDAVVGWYNAAYRLVTPLGFIPGALMASVFPTMSRYYVSSEDSLKIAYEKSFKYLLILALPIAVGTTILADRFILFLYGEEFSNAVIALQILIWAEAIIFLNIVLGTVLNSMDRQKLVTLFTGIAAALNVLLNLALIPPYSYKGAAVATVATEVLVFILCFSFISRHYKQDIAKLVASPLLSSILMGVLIYNLDFTWYVTILIAIGAYSMFLLITRGVNREDIELVKTLLKEQRQ